MTDDERRLESLRFLRESSAWMVGVQTAIFGFLITLLTAKDLELGSPQIKGAVTAFGVSIVCAGMVLGAIPWVLVREPPVTLVRKAPIAEWPLLRWVSIGLTSGVQYAAFFVGFAMLAAALWLGQFG